MTIISEPRLCATLIMNKNGLLFPIGSFVTLRKGFELVWANKEKIWVIDKIVLQTLAYIIIRHYIIDSLCTKKKITEKNGWKSCLPRELNPGLLGDSPMCLPLDHVATNKIWKKKLWTICAWIEMPWAGNSNFEFQQN